MSRRDDICQAAITLASRGGTHALTHQGIDRELGISQGSTSYYFRSRASLITAVAEFLTAESRGAFLALVDEERELAEGEVTAEYLTHLCTTRRDQVRARVALALDASCGPDQVAMLAQCLFSRSAAIELCKGRGSLDPESDATRLIDELDGAALRTCVFDARD